jgi:hypothetical protein
MAMAEQSADGGLGLLLECELLPRSSAFAAIVVDGDPVIHDLHLAPHMSSTPS